MDTCRSSVINNDDNQVDSQDEVALAKCDNEKNNRGSARRNRYSSKYTVD